MKLEKINRDKVALAISVFVIMVSLTVMVGWIFDIEVFKSLVPGYVEMKFNTALGFVLLGTAFLMFLKNAGTIGYKLVAWLLIIASLASMSQYFFNMELGVDEFFVSDSLVAKTSHLSPGRPSGVCLLCFTLLGIVFLIIDTANVLVKKIILSILNLVVFISVVTLIGYLLGVPSFYEISYFSSMAIHTALCILLLSVGIALVFKNMGMLSLFLSEKMGGVMTRRLFPRAIIFIVLLGFFRMQTLRHRVFSDEFGVAVVTTSLIFLATLLIFSTANMLNKIDSKRKEAEDEIILNNKNLEKTVAERTQYLTKQNKQLEDFAHIISHNLRGSVGNLDALLSFYNEEESQAEKDDLIEKCEITVNNIQTTLNDLMEIISIKHDAKKEKEKVVFETVFDKIKRTFEGEIMKTNAEIIVDFSNVTEMEYSAVYLESIMQNLFSNALKYRSPERTPVIRLETKATKKGVEFIISDNGLGIDLQRYGSKIFGFNKVFHDHPDAKGVGLFMTKTQIEGMGGEITVESQVDKGTTFRVFFNDEVAVSN